jgi:hypothetical protein
MRCGDFCAAAADGVARKLLRAATFLADRSMVFGHNTNLTVAGTVYHIQTEDRGAGHARIDTMVYCRGRVLHRRVGKYEDLLPLNAQREQALRKRVDDQHRTVVEEMRSGALPLGPSTENAPAAGDAAKTSSPAASAALAVELLNAKSWLTGKRATLQVAVRDKNGGTPVAGAHVAAKIEGAATTSEFTAQTDHQGQARIEFDMPAFSSSAEPALMIEAGKDAAKARLRFQLRARPRVPSA